MDSGTLALVVDLDQVGVEKGRTPVTLRCGNIGRERPRCRKHVVVAKHYCDVPCGFPEHGLKVTLEA
jgi:hypothetical protein